MTYFDYHTQAPLWPQVLPSMQYALSMGTNASSLHLLGRRARQIVQDVTWQIKTALGAQQADVIFTSGLAEANMLGIVGLARGNPNHKNLRLLTDNSAKAQEPGWQEAMYALQQMGCVIHSAQDHPNKPDFPSPASLSLLACSAAHPDTGVLQPLESWSSNARTWNVPLHVDASLLIGKAPVQFDGSGIATLSFCSARLGGPRGLGILLVRRQTPMEPLWQGGQQQLGLRAGTLPFALIAGFGAALQQVVEYQQKYPDHLATLLHRLAPILPKEPAVAALQTCRLLSLPGFLQQDLVDALSHRGIYVRCATDPTHGPLAVRLSWGWQSCMQEMETLLEALHEVQEGK